MFTSFGCTLGVHNPKGPGNQPAVQLIAASLPCDGPAWATGFTEWADFAAKNDVPIRLLFVFQLLSSAAEGAAAADAVEPWPSLGMSCFFLKKKHC